MSVFCPDGYVSTPQAIFKAAVYWFPEQMAELERAITPQPQRKPGNSFAAAVRALSQPQLPHALHPEFQAIVNQTVHRLRNHLHQGTPIAYYFGNDGCHSVLRDFWATAEADGVIESGTYWPFGEPSRWHDQRPSYPLFLKQSELDRLLSDQPTQKRSFPESKMPELVAALRKLDDLNRAQQRAALRKLPEFERYHITDDLFREAEKQVPRRPGRKPLRSEQ